MNFVVGMIIGAACASRPAERKPVEMPDFRQLQLPFEPRTTAAQVALFNLYIGAMIIAVGAVTWWLAGVIGPLPY